MPVLRMSHNRGGVSSLPDNSEPSCLKNGRRSLFNQNKSGLKKAVRLLALFLAFSARILSAQDPTIDPCPVEPIAQNLGTAATASLCPTPTPTPTPAPTPTPPPPSPTPTPISGKLGPKYMVLMVTYAPPGSSSTVVYNNSTLRGVSSSISGSFTNDTKVSTSLSAGAGVEIPGVQVDSSVTVGSSLEIQEQLDASASIAVNYTQASGTTMRGPSSSAVGIDHDQDYIWIWLNPVVFYDVNSDTEFAWKGFGYDLRDPALRAHILGIPVKYLNGHAAMPSDIAAVLQRTWAPRILCSSTDPDCGPDGTKGPGLTANDFIEILKADPFTDPNYVVNIPAGYTCTLDQRFCLTNNQTLEYLPAPPGGQPITETYTLGYQAVSTEALAASLMMKIGFSDEFGVTAKAAGAKLEAKLKEEDTISWMVKVSGQATQQTTQTATANITGPTANDNYTGPVTLNVFQDTLYETFMFNFVQSPTFAMSASPTSQGVIQGSCVNYNLLVSALIPGFGGAITFRVDGLPANATAGFSPASINGAGSSTLTVCTSAATPLGNQTLTVSGSYGAEIHSLFLTLAVNPPPNFTLTVSPSGQTIIAGNSANFAVSTTSVSGFAGNVALSVTGLPAGAVATFSPASVAAGSSSTLYISTSTITQTGSYSLVITGTSGNLSHSATVVLGLTAPTPPPCSKPTCRVQN